MNTNLKILTLALSTVAMLSGCGSLLNTADSGEYACPGMPLGVVCKTPAAVYKSTNIDVPDTEFDTPIGFKAQKSNTPDVSASQATRAMTVAKSATQDSGPKPVREPAKVVRIWIAPWVDKQDNLHLAQVQFAEVKPRTWTVGKPESTGASGYTIPHLAFNSITAVNAHASTPQTQTDATPNEHTEKAQSDDKP